MNVWFRLLTITICISPLTSALAQDAAAKEPTARSNVLEEVYVTARKRTEKLQETPVAVSALDADALAEAGITAITDLQQSVPGLQFGESGSKTPAIFIRGIGQREAAAVLDPGVGVYLNGIFIARQDSQLLDTVDTQTIQVLRGPQGTLFGKNNTGGAILVSTREPDLESLEGSLLLRPGNFGRRDAKFSGNIPLVEGKVGLRFALNSKRSDGYFDNRFDGGTFGDEDRVAATGRLLWDVSETFSVDVFSYWSRQDELSTGISCLLQNPESNIAQLRYPNRPDFADACAASEAAVDDRELVVNRADSRIAMDTSIFALTLNWALSDDYELKSISGLSLQNNIVRNDDQDGTEISAVNNGSIALNSTLEADGEPVPEEERMQFSQELQLNGAAFSDRLQFTLGAFASLETIDDNPFAQLIGPKGLGGIRPSTACAAGSPALGALCVGVDDGFVFPLATFLATRSNLENKSWALFAQGSYELTEYLSLTVGGRYTYEERERDLTIFEIDHQEYGQRLSSFGFPTSYISQAGFYSPVPVPIFDQIGQNIPDLPVIVRESRDVKQADWTDFSPSVTLSMVAPGEWLDTMNLDSFMVYATYSEGFKAGGFEPRGPELVPFEPEQVNNYEVGVKLDGLNSRLRFNAALYRLDYEEIQVRVAEQGERISDIYLFLSNAGLATVQGLEMESTLVLGNWFLQGSFSYTDASYDEFMGQIVIPGQGQDTVDRSEEDFALVPETTYSLAVMYQWMTPIGLIMPRLAYYHRDELFTGIDFKAVEYESSYVDALDMFNARLSWIPSETFRLTAFVDNLADREYFKSGFSVSAALGAATLVQGNPRTFGLEVALDF
ncbi:TonB-dependent receptor [Litorivivens sp.]|uniref:TonB-dependent receptor n=2 Tax=Litorivivens sp. TaxID=2020868 RepID=UPI003563CB83